MLISIGDYGGLRPIRTLSRIREILHSFSIPQDLTAEMVQRMHLYPHDHHCLL